MHLSVNRLYEQPLIVTYIVNLNEFSLVRFLILIMLRREVYVLWIETIFPQLKRYVRAIAEWSVRKGCAKWAVDLCPERVPEWDYPPRALIHNIFAETEEWQNTYYEFVKAEQSIPDYAYAYKQATCCHTWQKHVPVLILRSILENRTEESIEVVGLPREDVAILEALCRDSLVTRVKPAWIPNRLLNFVILLLNLAYGFGFVVSRLKPFGVKPRSFFLAADYMFDPRDVRLYQELEEGGPILLVYRIVPPDTEKFPALANYEYCKPTDGVFSLIDAVSTFGMVVFDCLRSFRHFGHLDSAHFYKFAALPNRRAILRGLFNKYRPRYFWGRDPYNVVHILRHQELDRIGGISLGIANELPAYSIVFPHIRYISFDCYFVYGTELYDKYYAKNWPHSMKLIPAASHSLTREQLDAASDPKPVDIAIFSAIFIPEPNLVLFVRTLAKYLPERTIFLQVKHSYIGSPVAEEFIAASTDGLTNVHYVTNSVYDLLLKTRYAFSDPSSVIAEAVQMGVCSFSLDLSPIQKTTIYREYADICVASAEEAVEKIRRLESEKWKYPFDTLSNLIDQSGRTSVDAACSVMGVSRTRNSVAVEVKNDNS